MSERSPAAAVIDLQKGFDVIRNSCSGCRLVLLVHSGEGFRTVGERRPAATVAMVEGGVGCNLLIVGGVGCTRAESQFQLF